MKQLLGQPLRRPLVMLTAADYPTAKLLDESGIDIVLVGDSLGMAVLGFDTTVPVTLSQMVHHTQAVRRAVKKALLVTDLPYESLRSDAQTALAGARRLVEEAGAQAVKVEWNERVLDQVRAIRTAGIEVVGHVGLTPQTAARKGGFRMRGKDPAEAEHIFEHAKSMERVGCFSIVLECIPTALAKRITTSVAIPTIGIGAGPHCDGQVLVTHDLLGLYQGQSPNFAKQYAHLSDVMRRAFGRFKKDVQGHQFPSH